MNLGSYTLACCCDFAGQVRGKGFPTKDLDNRLSKGVGWTPTNIMINCFGEIPATPWGPAGDLVLRPDPAAAAELDFGDGEAVEQFVLGDIYEMDDTPWVCCPRSYLRAALDRLRDSHGLVLKAAFEHEFTITTLEPKVGGAYNLEAVRQIDALPGIILAMADKLGLAPDTFLPEFSPGQFEITVDPALGLEASDRAVILRQAVRAAAIKCGHRASFSPIMREGGVGNGVHIHFSFLDLDGNPVAFDADRRHGVSDVASKFLAGIIRNGRALVSITAPSAISYERLRPNAWSASVTNLGVRDREAFVRVCPVSDVPGADIAHAYNFEYRAADAAASPYLALGALVYAGLDGLSLGEDVHAPVSAAEAAGLSNSERADRNIETLPQSLEEALTALEANTVLMPEAMRDPYVMHKRGERASADGFSGDELFRMYAQAY